MSNNTFTPPNPFKRVYMAVLEQLTEDADLTEKVVFQNTLGFTPQFIKTGTGQYTATNTEKFNSDKIFVMTNINDMALETRHIFTKHDPTTKTIELVYQMNNGDDRDLYSDADNKLYITIHMYN